MSKVVPLPSPTPAANPFEALLARARADQLPLPDLMAAAARLQELQQLEAAALLYETWLAHTSAAAHRMKLNNCGRIGKNACKLALTSTNSAHTLTSGTPCRWAVDAIVATIPSPMRHFITSIQWMPRCSTPHASATSAANSWFTHG